MRKKVKKNMVYINVCCRNQRKKTRQFLQKTVWRWMGQIQIIQLLKRIVMVGYCLYHNPQISELNVQSTLVISKSKGPSETLRDIRTSTYQMCSIEENTNGTTKFFK